MMNKMTLMSIALCVSYTVAELELTEAGVSSGSNVGKKDLKPTVDSFVEEGGFAWLDSHGGQATFQDYPQHYLKKDDPNFPSYQLKVPTAYLAKAGTYAIYRCTNTNNQCDVVVFAFECNGCGRALKTGKLFQQLTQKDFERTRCAPTFKTGKVGGRKYQMVAYVKTLEPGDVETITLEEDTHFVAFSMSEGSAPACSSLNNVEQECELDTAFRCQVKGDCALRKCVAPGPGLGCTYCPLDEYL